MANKFRVALIQLLVGANKQENIKRAVEHIHKAAQNNAKVVVLPECFNSPYGVKYFPQYCETIPNGETTQALSKVSKDLGIYLVGGSIPEKDGDRMYNTCSVFDPKGELIAKHRKVHLFDIDIPNKITFKESTNLSPGNSITMFDTPFCRIGVGICYDIRFPELAMIYQKHNCSMILYPGAFNLTTGPAHWDLLLRSRAVDNQLYVAGISPARDNNADYKAWGHSTCYNAFGELLTTTEENEDIIYADIDIDKMNETRKNLPYLTQKRSDLYEVKYLKETN